MALITQSRGAVVGAASTGLLPDQGYIHDAALNVESIFFCMVVHIII